MPTYKKKRRSKGPSLNLKIQIMGMDINQEDHLIITRTVMMKKEARKANRVKLLI
jgi:hypothetical protein